MTRLPHFLKDTDLDRATLAEVLELAARLKRERGRHADQPLAGQTWALLFHKSSTRTRVSFEVGIHELGGHPMILDQNRMQSGRGETLEDTARVLSRYLHGIVIRTYEHAIVETFAAAGSIPVVNALTDLLHPCQILSDLFTLSERWGRDGARLGSLRGRRLAFYGDCSCNVAQSLILGGALAGMEVVLCGPEGYQPAAAVDQLLRDAGLPGTWRFNPDPLAAARGADVLYTDVWVSMGAEEQRERRLRELRPYQVNAAVMAAAKPDALFLHCLPAHVGEEVSAEVYAGPRSIVYDQAENRLHAQKALLTLLARGL